jgi:UDP-N-acetylglucosamine/UDP-N-acetylgalactosamine 4-epimerase
MIKILDQHNFNSERYLVTGAAGFIGSNLCIELVSRGADVIGIDNLSYGKIENLDEIIEKPNFRFIKLDILSEREIIIATQGIDYILHQAALGSVPRSFEFPDEYYKNNFLGTVNVINAARINNVKKVVYASSSSVYGDSLNIPRVEDNIGFPLSPYAHSKKLVEEFATVYSKLFDLDLIGLRYFNVYGPKQDSNRMYPAVIAAFCEKAIRGDSLIVYGDGNQRRDFTFVNDVVSANILAAITDTRGNKVFNVGTGMSTSINEIINIISGILKVKIDVKYEKERKGDVKESFASISKIRETLNFSNSYSLMTGIKQLIEYSK